MSLNGVLTSMARMVLSDPSVATASQTVPVPGSADPAAAAEFAARMHEADPVAADAQVSWLRTATDIIGSEALSLPDLYRLQVVAAVAQIETTRTTGAARSMDEGLKNLLKHD